jgi:hypothetical protein
MDVSPPEGGLAVNVGDMFITPVDCSDYTAYSETSRTWFAFGPSSAFHRSCANWR